MNVTWEQFRDSLVQLREKTITQKEIAKKMGCTQSKVSKFENHPKPDDIKLRIFKRYFHALIPGMTFRIDFVPKS